METCIGSLGYTIDGENAICGQRATTRLVFHSLTIEALYAEGRRLGIPERVMDEMHHAYYCDQHAPEAVAEGLPERPADPGPSDFWLVSASEVAPVILNELLDLNQTHHTP